MNHALYTYLTMYCLEIAYLIFPFFIPRLFGYHSRTHNLFFWGFVSLLVTVFNMFYTGMMGWHMFAASFLEFVLDFITLIAGAAASIMYWWNLTAIINDFQRGKRRFDR